MFSKNHEVVLQSQCPSHQNPSTMASEKFPKIPWKLVSRKSDANLQPPPFSRVEVGKITVNFSEIIVVQKCSKESSMIER